MLSGSPAVGEHWVYRKNDAAPSEQVEVLDLTQQGRKERAHVRFVATPGGRVEVVPRNRLRTKWANVDAFDTYMDNIARLAEFELHDVEDIAIGYVFADLVPESVATITDKPNYNVLTIHDPSRFEQLLGCPIADLTSRCFSCEVDGKQVLSREATLIAAELICRRDPQPILDVVYEEELEARERCMRGRPREQPTKYGSTTTDPHWEWKFYVEYTRPRLELLRQWCGFRAVTADERRRAAEQEARRLELLLVRATDELKKHAPVLADVIGREHEAERITPKRVRPQVDRPLLPSEMPVREIKVRSRRWW